MAKITIITNHCHFERHIKWQRDGRMTLDVDDLDGCGWIVDRVQKTFSVLLSGVYHKKSLIILMLLNCKRIYCNILLVRTNVFFLSYETQMLQFYLCNDKSSSFHIQRRMLTYVCTYNIIEAPQIYTNKA